MLGSITISVQDAGMGSQYPKSAKRSEDHTVEAPSLSTDDSRRGAKSYMHGIRLTGFTPPTIQSVPGSTKPSPLLGAAKLPYRSVFELLAKLLSKEVTPCYWLAQWFASAPLFDLLLENNLNSVDLLDLPEPSKEIESNDTDALLFAPGTFPKYSSYIHDDWIHLIGLEADHHRIDTIAAKLVETGRSAALISGKIQQYRSAIEEHASLCFLCIDGTAWEAFSRNSGILERILPRLEYHRLDVQTCQLQDSLSIGTDAK